MFDLTFSNFGVVLFVGIALSWLLSQGLKIFTSPKKTFSHVFFTSGLGPSSHVAPLVTLTVLILFHEGVSTLFVLSFALLAIVFRDSLGVRYAVGKNASVLKSSLKGKKLSREVVVEKGHSFKEIVAGCLIGLFVAVVFTMVFL